MSDHDCDCDEYTRLKLEYLYNLLDEDEQQDTCSEELEDFFNLMEIKKAEEQEDEIFNYYSSNFLDCHLDEFQKDKPIIVLRNSERPRLPYKGGNVMSMIKVMKMMVISAPT
jgi:hypothetical protein